MEHIIQFMSENPHLSVVLVVMGVFRAIFKPIMTLLQSYVEATPDKADDEKLARLKESKPYKVLAWLVDYLASVKLPK